MVYCQNCGSKNVDDAKFCVNCGAEIKRVEEVKKEAIIKQPEKPPKPSPKPFLSRTIFIIILIVIVAIVSFSIGVLVNRSSERSDNISVGNIVTFSVQEFYDALEYNIDNKNYTIYSNIKGVKENDILRITGKIDQIVKNYDEGIGEYTSIALYYSNESSLLIHVLGNVSDKYDVGDYVITTFHIIKCNGVYEDLYGATWYLSGEFMIEEFLNGKFVFDLIIPQNQIKKI